MNRESVVIKAAEFPDIRVNIFERDQPREYEVGILVRDGLFWVYMTSERASILVQRTFATESEALAKFLVYLDLERQRRDLYGPGSRP
ncbi:MAG: hypothetical protein HGA51_05940 [Demequinaceae bacterium]|nr:hypothetical protein [Demequinaceae bacterium]